MHLVSITVLNYRSITQARKIRLGQSTILVGPNNEGKSNILRALAAAMRVLTRHRIQQAGSPNQGRVLVSSWYSWERDFPLSLQSQMPNGKSVITLEFQLTDDEVTEFWNEIRSDLDGTLPIRISLGESGKYQIEVAKKGRGARSLTAKSGPIAKFVSSRLNFEHFPAVRTADSAKHMVSAMVERELSVVEDDEEYKKALSALRDIQRPILEKLAASIKETLVQFLPEIKDVKFEINEEETSEAISRQCRIVIDDGAPTQLEFKGDGAQSLAALGIMRHRSETSAIGRNLVIAIEEPESHLHPSAIHRLKSILNELSRKHQVILTTHNPLYIDRVNLRSNIIVQGSKARPARSVEELRTLLGVRAADNLRNAEIILLVEGEDDKVALTALLAHRNPLVRSAISNGSLALDTLHGGTNLSYKVAQHRDALCLVHCFLDDDNAGRSGFDRARMEGLVTDADVTWAICLGKSESEFEDLLDPGLYEAMVRARYEVQLSVPHFRSNRKWCVRMQETFRRQGKRWDDRVEMDVKARVAELVSASPDRAVLPAHATVIDALVRSLEARITSKSSTEARVRHSRGASV